MWSDMNMIAPLNASKGVCQASAVRQAFRWALVKMGVAKTFSPNLSGGENLDDHQSVMVAGRTGKKSVLTSTLTLFAFSRPASLALLHARLVTGFPALLSLGAGLVPSPCREPRLLSCVPASGFFLPVSPVATSPALRRRGFLFGGSDG